MTTFLRVLEETSDKEVALRSAIRDPGVPHAGTRFKVIHMNLVGYQAPPSLIGSAKHCDASLWKPRRSRTKDA